MEQEILLSVLTAITSALGVKEIWQLWKKRMELNEEKANKDARAKDKLMSEVIVDLNTSAICLSASLDLLLSCFPVHCCLDSGCTWHGGRGAF